MVRSEAKVWQMNRGGQTITRENCVITLTSGPAHVVVAVRLLVWSP